MSLYEKGIRRNVELFDRGLVTSREVAHAVVYDLTKCGEEVEVNEVCRSLPSAVMLELRVFLEELRENQYCWTPFLIGVAGGPISQSKLSAVVKRLEIAISAL